MRLTALFLLAAGVAQAQCTKPTISATTGTSDASGTQLTLTWTTSVAADSFAIYGWQNAGTPTPVTDTAGVTSHTVIITGLMPGQVYQWGVRSQAINAGVGCGVGYVAFDSAGNLGHSTTMTAPPAGSGFTYNMTGLGPTYVTQGYSVYIGLRPYILTGTFAPNGLKIVVSGLPSFTSVTWPDATTATGGYWAAGANAASTTTVARDTITIHDWYFFEAQIITNVGGTTPAGSYTLTFTASQNASSGYATVVVNWPLVVVSASAPFSGVALTPGTPSSYPAIPDLTTYISSANTYGNQNCAQDEQPGFRTIRANNTTSAPIATLTRNAAGTITTATTSSALPTGAQGINNNNYVKIAGATDATFNTSATVVMTLVNSTTFTYPNTGTANATDASGTATVTNQTTTVSTCCTYQTWFYDGVDVYYNVEKLLTGTAYTGQNWAQCRSNVQAVYNPFVNANLGSGNAFMGFSKGYYNDYLATSNATDITQINKINTVGNVSPVHGVLVDIGYDQRETAYMMRNMMHGVLLGQTPGGVGNLSPAQMRDYAEDHVLGMIDQICLTQNPQYYESFMMGIEAMELVDYYQLVTHDPRIPPALACLASWMNTNLWQALNTGSHPYDKYQLLMGYSYANGATSCLNTLNNMISPMYAWLFQYTGDATWQTEGDPVWDHGVLFDCTEVPPSSGINANLTYPFGSNGKSYSQQYQWGPNYITWRSSTTPNAGPGQMNGRNYNKSNGRAYSSTVTNGRTYH